MQARRGTALLLSCVLGLFLLTAIHGGTESTHSVHGVALLAPSSFDSPHPWRSPQDDAAAIEAVRAVGGSARTGSATTVRQLTSSITRSPHVRGPPGSALA